MAGHSQRRSLREGDAPSTSYRGVQSETTRRLSGGLLLHGDEAGALHGLVVPAEDKRTKQRFGVLVAPSVEQLRRRRSAGVWSLVQREKERFGTNGGAKGSDQAVDTKEIAGHARAGLRVLAHPVVHCAAASADQAGDLLN